MPTLIRGEVITLDPSRPKAEALLVLGGRVLETGPDAVRSGREARLVELAAGEMAVPGFVDSHLHLLAMAAARLSVDTALPTLGEALSAIAAAAAVAPAGAWLRAVGYDDALVEERRLPFLAELDEAGGGRPLVLHHRTGHLAMLNSAALEALGLPPRSDPVLVDRHDLLRAVPPMPVDQLGEALKDVLRDLEEAGIVAVTDATHTNDLDSLQVLDQQGVVDVTAMAGWDRLEGLVFGSKVGGVTVGHAKIMPTAGGVLSRSGETRTLAEAVARAHRAGFPVAVHVMEIDVLAETIGVLSASPPPAGTRDRIEHCSLALPEQLAHLGDLPVEVVTQPSFVTHRAEKYMDQLNETERRWLWPAASVLAAGVPLRLSSDAPVVPARPVEWLAAATRRHIQPAERLPLVDAVGACSAGAFGPGLQATVVVVDRDLRGDSRVLRPETGPPAGSA